MKTLYLVVVMVLLAGMSYAQDFPTPKQVAQFTMRSDSLYSDSLFSHVRRLIAEDLRDDGEAIGWLVLGDGNFYKKHLWAIKHAKGRIETALTKRGWSITWELEHQDIAFISHEQPELLLWTVKAKERGK